MTRVVETEKEVPVEVTCVVVQAPAVDTDRELWVMHWENVEYDAFNEEFTEQTGIKITNMTFPVEIGQVLCISLPCGARPGFQDTILALPMT